MIEHPDTRISMPGERDIVLSRLFAAPRELVFDAWTKPELLTRWHGPHGWTLIVCDIDLRPEGAFRFVSRRPDGRTVGQYGVYKEVRRPERLVHTESWEDWNPGESQVTIDFSEEGAQTRVVQTLLFPSKEVRDKLLEAGLTSNTAASFARLDEVVTAPKRDLVVRRRYRAPLSAVWNAWTDSEAVKCWWGPRGFTAPVAKMDVREGGTSLVCMRTPSGQDLYSTWTYDKVVPHQLLEYVFDLSDAHGSAIEPTEQGLPADFPRHVRHSVSFAALGEATELVVVEQGYTSERHFELSKQGLGECLDKMADLLHG